MDDALDEYGVISDEEDRVRPQAHPQVEFKAEEVILVQEEVADESVIYHSAGGTLEPADEEGVPEREWFAETVREELKQELEVFGDRLRAQIGLDMRRCFENLEKKEQAFTIQNSRSGVSAAPSSTTSMPGPGTREAATSSLRPALPKKQISARSPSPTASAPLWRSAGAEAPVWRSSDDSDDESKYGDQITAAGTIGSAGSCSHPVAKFRREAEPEANLRKGSTQPLDRGMEPSFQRSMQRQETTHSMFGMPSFTLASSQFSPASTHASPSFEPFTSRTSMASERRSVLEAFQAHLPHRASEHHKNGQDHRQGHTNRASEPAVREEKRHSQVSIESANNRQKKNTKTIGASLLDELGMDTSGPSKPGYLEDDQLDYAAPILPTPKPQHGMKFSERVSVISGSSSCFSPADELASEDDDGKLMPNLFQRLCRRPRQIVQRFVESHPFEMFVSVCIVSNSILIGVQSDYLIKLAGSDHGEQYESAEWLRSSARPLRTADRVICVFFVVEHILRLFAYGWVFFRLPEWKWNIVDLALVLLQVVDIIVSGLSGEADGQIIPVNVTLLRVLRVLRLTRIVRLVRLLRFVQELRTMVTSLVGSLRSLVWTMVLIVLIIYVVSVCLVTIIADKGARDPRIFEQPGMRSYFSSLARTGLSLYQAMTGGVDWNEVQEPVWEGISPWLSFVFVIYIAFAILVFMNVVTGVFVESALLTAKQEKEKDLMYQLDTLFQLTSKNGDTSETITWSDFAALLSNPDSQKQFRALEIDIKEARGLFILLDTDESGEIDAEEFKGGFSRLRGPAKAIDVATLMYANKRMLAWWRDNFQRIDSQLNDIYDILRGDSSMLLPQGANGSDVVPFAEGQDPSSVLTVTKVNSRESTDRVGNVRSATPGPDTDGDSCRFSGQSAAPFMHGVSSLPHVQATNSKASFQGATHSRAGDLAGPDPSMFATWTEVKTAGKRREESTNGNRRHSESAHELKGSRRGSAIQIAKRSSEDSTNPAGTAAKVAAKVAEMYHKRKSAPQNVLGGDMMKNRSKSPMAPSPRASAKEESLDDDNVSAQCSDMSPKSPASATTWATKQQRGQSLA